MKYWPLLLFIFLTQSTVAQYSYKIGLVQYEGGGDWYANLETSLPNLIAYSNDVLNTSIDPEQGIVHVGDRGLYSYPFLHLTGHGNIVLNDAEAENLRAYLIAGGFLHADDNYGMDVFFRTAMKKVFPELAWVELPPSHPIFHQTYEFANGLPKIHEHDEQRPQAFGLYYEGRMVCLYTFESDLGDGWEDPRIHNDSKENHERALQMGVNILQFVFLNDEHPG